MRRFFLGFFLILFILLFNKNFVFAIDYDAQIKEKAKDVVTEVVEDVKEKVEEKIPGAKTEQEEAEDKGKKLDKKNAEKVKSMSEIDSKLKDCSKENDECCLIEIKPPEKLADTGNKTLEAVNQEVETESIKLCGGENLYAVTDETTKQCKCIKEDISLGKLCERISSAGEQAVCKSCSERGVWTALGCIDFSLKGFIKNTLLGWGIGLAGVVSLLCIIYSAFMMQISGGNPEKLKKTRERLNSCIIGLILIIFSVFILRVIGVDILQIPGFNK